MMTPRRNPRKSQKIDSEFLYNKIYCKTIIQTIINIIKLSAADVKSLPYFFAYLLTNRLFKSTIKKKAKGDASA